jgi:nitrilase
VYILPRLFCSDDDNEGWSSCPGTENKKSSKRTDTMTQSAAPTATSINVLACQIDIPSMTKAAQRDAHLHRSADRIRAAIERSDVPLDLVVLPELSSLDYSEETFAHLPELSEPLDGPSFQTWRGVALEAGVYVCFSFARLDDTETYICMAVVGPDGELVGHYDKLHLAQFGASSEKNYFSRGGHVFTFEINGFKLAPIICYDIRIPELCRTLVIDHQVDAILHCGAYYRDESFHTWHMFAVTRALENQVFFLSLNRAGDTYGKSLFCLPWHDETNPPTEFHETKEDLRCLSLNKADILAARRDYSFLKDRLPSYNLSYPSAS